MQKGGQISTPIDKQSTILAGDADGVEQVLNVLADAVTKGELDTQLASAAANRKKAGKKSA